MAYQKKLLILRLEGALQSWGEMSKWDFRDSADFPTKSGIVGLLGCALGIERGDPALSDLSNSVTIAIRSDRAGIRTIDFQTITGNPLRNAEGKPKSGGNTIISQRAYLQDACFTVFLDADDSWRDRIISAIKSPRWPVFLGRKCCIPSRPVWETVTTDYPTLEDAVRRYPAADRSTYPMLCEFEEDCPDLSSYLRPDRMVESNRNFAMRRIWRGAVKEASDVSG